MMKVDYINSKEPDSTYAVTDMNGEVVVTLDEAEYGGIVEGELYL